jgi:hypothetical protein
MTTKTPTKLMTLPQSRPVEIEHVAVREFSSDSTLAAIIGQAEQQGWDMAAVNGDEAKVFCYKFKTPLARGVLSGEATA